MSRPEQSMRTGWAGAVVIAAAISACYGGAGDGTAPLGPGGTMADTPGGTSPTASGNTSDGGAGSSSGLPCDVEAAMRDKCTSCHGRPPTGGAPVALVTYEDLVAKSPSDATKSVAQVSLERMQNASAPMPPSGPATATEVTALNTWIAAGLPRTACGTSAGTGGGNTGGTTTPSPYDTPVQCTSKSTWKNGDRGSASMHPGLGCISCHSSGEGPRYSIAGTVYPSAHEPNDCNGSSGGATVVITDAKGVVVSIPVGSVGNFSSSKSITPPYRAKVVVGTKERAMVGTQTNGDCNSCHTQTGTQSAPGRIMAP